MKTCSQSKVYRQALPTDSLHGSDAFTQPLDNPTTAKLRHESHQINEFHMASAALKQLFEENNRNSSICLKQQKCLFAQRISSKLKNIVLFEEYTMCSVLR